MTQRTQFWILLAAGFLVVAICASGAMEGRPFAIAAIVVAVPTMIVTAWRLYVERGRRKSSG